MRNLVATITALTNDDDGNCASQSGTGGTALTLNGALVSRGVAVIATGFGQKVTVTSAGNDSGITFAIVGLDPDGTQITETLTGANTAAANSTNYYSKVISITPSGNTAAAVIVGVLSAQLAQSKSLRVNGQQMDFKLGLYVDVVSGTLTYTAQYTYQQPEDTYTVSYSSSADWRSVDGLAALTADGVSNIFYKVNAVRLILTAYTSGSVKLTVTQSY